MTNRQGVSRERYSLVPRTLIFLTRGKSVLLLRGAQDKRLYANRYNGVGGHVERGEDVLAAARRELWEESGLVPDSLRLVGTVMIDTGSGLGVGLFVFTGECARGTPRASREGTLEWLPLAGVFDLPLVEDLHVLLPRVLAHAPGDPPFSALYTEVGDSVEVHFAP